MTTVLLVEDSRTQAAAACVLLESRGFVPEVAADLSIALEKLAASRPDVVLLDMILPDATGLDGLRRLRDQDADVPIVILTSVEDESLALEALQVGAQDYVIKGSQDPALLARTLRHAIERQRILSQLDALTEELREKNDSLNRLNAQKDRFLGMAAHDMRNPLSVVISFADFMLGSSTDPLTAEQREFLGIMRKSANFMLELVNDILDISAIESGLMRFTPKPTDLVALVHRAVELNCVLAQPKGIRIRFEPQGSVPPVLVDPGRIEQVLGNLLTNGVKFSASGTEIQVTLRADGDHVILGVADQGQGMPPSDLEKLFEPLWKKSVRSTAGEKDTGLGLAIVQNIVARHGGTITAESAVGEGTRFEVRLPIAR